MIWWGIVVKSSQEMYIYKWILILQIQFKDKVRYLVICS